MEDHVFVSFIATLCGMLGMPSPGIQETAPTIKQVSPTGISHGVLALGADTFLVSADNRILWTYPRSTRDGWLLPNGHLLLVITKCPDYPNGGVVEIGRQGKTYFEYKGTQSEVDTAQALPHDHFLVTESGPKPRLMEMDRTGKVLVEFPLQCQTQDFHMQTRMARKLHNGHYLVPHLIDQAVREYAPDGKVVWEVKTPHWPFTAIRLDNGHTLIDCTRGNLVIEVDQAGKTVWQLTNDDLPGAPIKDACGAQRLANGDTVITSYGSGGADEIKLFEVTPDKKIVWSLYTGRTHGIHEFQILDAQGQPLKGRPLR
jgi:hypothetical protein